MANPYAINFGSIPFSGAPGAMLAGLGGTPQQALSALGPAYQSSYNAALDFNRQLGDTINTGYNRTMEQQIAGQQGINDTISAYGQSAGQDLLDQYTRAKGSAAQGLISRGLGNTTVLDSVDRGLGYDYAKGGLHLADQLAAMRAGYQNQFNQQNTGLAGQQLGFLERMTGQYPNAGLYGQLATQAGAAQQSQQSQEAINRQLDEMGGGFSVNRAGGGIGAGGQGARQQAYSPGVGGVGSIGYASPTGAGIGAGAFGYASSPGFRPAMSGQANYGPQVEATGYYDEYAPVDYGYDDMGAYGWAGGPEPPDSGYRSETDYGGAPMGDYYDLAGEDLPYGGSDYDPFMDEWYY